MALKVTVEQRQKVEFVVFLSGEIDSQTYTELEAALKPLLITSTKVLIINMAEVTYISSMGISIILSTKKAIEQKKSSFIMTNLQPQIKLAFDIIKALGDMHVFQNIDEADEYLAEMERKEIEKQGGSS